MNVPRNLKRGDVVSVHWVDITEDPAGDPRAARLTERGPTVTHFWGSRRSHGSLCAVFSSTFEPDPVQQGYLIIPWRLITSVTRRR